MSNQIGDRYSCSDPNCGCEIEIERPSSMLAGSAGGHSDSASASSQVPTGSESSMTQKFREFRSEGAISTPGDFGAQGATGEGNFGTTGDGRSATASGRYDTESTRFREGDASEGANPRGNVKQTLTCFCGHEMRPVATAQQRASVARPGI
jgi:hypothetical protein